MKVEEFVRQLNYPARKVVLDYLNEAETKRNMAIEDRNGIVS